MLLTRITRNAEPIYNIPVGQLGNCLRTTMSMKILADEMKRPFKIDISYVHEKEQKVLKLLFPEFIDLIPSYKKWEQSDIIDTTVLTNTDPQIEGKFIHVPNESFGVSHIYAIKLDSMDDNEFIKRKIENYKKLPWPEFNFQDLSDVTGVHIRYSDNTSDPSKKEINTSIDQFKDKLKTVDKPFLLCSDNQEIIDYVKEEYPNTIFPDKQDDPDLQGFYEMVLLSRTKHLVGSYASTFSYEASFFRGIPLEIYEKGKWKIYT
jgi:DNA-directed RNA polymerase delta subunit